ncbi:IQ domain-containing protein K, partial [Varanus komodoensis]
LLVPFCFLWKKKEFEAEQPLHPDQDEWKQKPLLDKKEEPALTLQVSLTTDTTPPLNGDRSKSASTDELVLQKTPSLLSLPLAPELPDLKTCSPREFLESYIFPELLPGMVELLHQAKKEKCFERKRTRFIALDFLTEWLYNHNPKRKDEPFVEFFEIPFVKDWLKEQPLCEACTGPVEIAATKQAAVLGNGQRSEEAWAHVQCQGLVLCGTELVECRRQRVDPSKIALDDWEASEASDLSACMLVKSSADPLYDHTGNHQERLPPELEVGIKIQTTRPPPSPDKRHPFSSTLYRQRCCMRPRPPIALSLILTEEEAGNIIQSFWRGYRVRCEPEVQELRQWQKHLRETKNIKKRVQEFWAKQEKKGNDKKEL